MFHKLVQPRGYGLAVVTLVVVALVVATFWTLLRTEGSTPAGGGAPSPSGLPPPEQPSPRAETLFGTAPGQVGGETRAQAFERSVLAYGRPDVVRVFSAAVPPWWGALSDDVNDTPSVVSFKIPPTEVLSGTADGRLRAWFSSAPTDRDTYWIYFHEPEDNIAAGDYSAAEFIAAWEHIAALAAKSENERLHATVTLMCWTLGDHSGRDWHDYMPDPELVDVLAWDCYNHAAADGDYLEPEALLGDSVRASAEVGAGWAISELGSRIATGDDGSGRAAWLVDVGAYAREHDAVFVTYFDGTVGGDFRLTDNASMQAWAEVVRG